MKPILTIDRLRVSRGGGFGLHIRTLQLNTGTVICVVGPNGSGKTTLLECVTGLLTPAVGAITIADVPVGMNLRATKRMLGFVPDDDAWMVKELCAKEYFALLQGVYRQAGTTVDISGRIAAIAEQLHFTAFEQQLSRLSHGNKKKVQLIAGLMHAPQLIVLDELRNGLDPLSIIAAETLIREEARRGTGVIAATHDLWWAQRISHEVVVLLDGVVAIHQRTDRLVKQYGSLEKLFLAITQPKAGYERL